MTPRLLDKESEQEGVPDDVIVRKLSQLRDEVGDLAVPASAYLGLYLMKEEIVVADQGGQLGKLMYGGTEDDESVCLFLREKAEEMNVKYIGAGLAGFSRGQTLASRLWRDLDIVPFVSLLDGSTDDPLQAAIHLAGLASSRFNQEGVPRVALGSANRVLVHNFFTRADYERIATEQEIKLLEQFAERLAARQIVFISATPQGGGVALMRHGMVRLFHAFNIDVRWHVLRENADAFDITKTKFHNVLQAVAAPDVELTDADKVLFTTWSRENAEYMAPALKTADVIIIDDPQPAGLMPYIHEHNPEAKIIYRSHIQLMAGLADTPGTAQYKTWQFIWQFIQSADLFISHPVREFVPKGFPPKQTLLMPPSTDALDGLNKPLKREQIDYYVSIFNRFLLETQQEILDLDRPFVAQIARFDPSKGIPDVIESYAKLRAKLVRVDREVPQLVIAGHGSIDDPDGGPVYKLARSLLEKPEYSCFAADVKVGRLPHVDQLLNVLLQEAQVVLQLSHREGYEIKVTEALQKGKPVIAYAAGGIPQQIRANENGFVVPVGDTAAVADHLYDLLTDQDLYDEMSQAAKRSFRRDVLNIPNAINWLFLADQLLSEKKIDVTATDFNQTLEGLPGDIRVLGDLN
jgi:glycosyltransferase involved in cell wall biosynthesis